jgi:hypothetical protein
LKAGHAGEIRARNWLASSDKVENNAAIDVSGCLAGSDLGVREVNSFH